MYYLGNSIDFPTIKKCYLNFFCLFQERRGGLQYEKLPDLRLKSAIRIETLTFFFTTCNLPLIRTYFFASCETESVVKWPFFNVQTLTLFKLTFQSFLVFFSCYNFYKEILLNSQICHESTLNLSILKLSLCWH